MKEYRVNKGDIIKIGRKEYRISLLLTAEHYTPEGWFIEFYDAAGRYHYWKQYEDGGELLNVMPSCITIGKFEGGIYYKRGETRYINCQGTDCTDLFRKYGYNV